jgi:cytoskeletal protein CcmA (bactofilin family)
MKNKGLKFLILVTLLLLPFSALKATDGRAGNNIYVAKDDVISGNFYAAGTNVTIDGSIGGDLIVAGQTVSVNGPVEGDIIAAGQNITINGPVGGNVRVGGNSLTINGSVARNVNAFGANVVLGPESNIGWDVYAVGARLEARGMINGHLNGYTGQALIAGKIGKSVNLNLPESRGDSSLTLAPTAVISGDLTYTAKNAANIPAPASVAGKTEQKLPAVRETDWPLVWLWGELFAIFSALIVGLVLIFGLKNITTGVLNKLEKTPAKNLLPGLIFMLVIPPVALILMFTLIGIPLALIIMALWLILSYLARIITALWIGHLIVAKISKQKLSPIWSLVLGVTLLWLLSAIPFIGWLICLIAAWLGLGAIWSYAYDKYRNI